MTLTTACAALDGAGHTSTEATRMSLTSTLYKLARLFTTGRAVRTGHAGRRAKNIALGRTLGKAGVWKGLWR